ncbi:MAG TPA: methyl-accepting chemotaxis protein [Leptospiraceae bacterium]|nr:methyl-accepting chemotaxis protein [Leptospiraceae bacterium]
MKKLQEKFRLQSISTKLLISQILLFGIAVLLLMLLSTKITRIFFLTSEEENLIQTNRQVLDMVEMYDVSLKQTAARIANIFRLTGGNRGTENVTEQEIDDFTVKTGAAATIFRKQGDDFLRIKTSILKQDRTRAVGTMLDRKHPAYRHLLEGKPFFGKAKLFGKDYMTFYEPVLEGGTYTGARFIGIDITKDMEDLKQKIRRIKIGETGYSYVMDSSEEEKGILIVHPAKEGANVLNSRGSDGTDFVGAMLNNKSGVIYYSWINEERGEIFSREKVAVYDRYPEWNWIIVSGSYVSEILQDGKIMMTSLIIGLCIFFLLLMAVQRYIAVTLVKEPLQNLTDVMDRISGGDLTLASESAMRNSKDETDILQLKLIGFASKVRDAIGRMMNASIHLNDSAGRMTRTSEGFSSSAAEQSASAMQITSSLSLISSSMDRIASLSSEQNGNLEKMFETGASLSGIIEKMEKTMRESFDLSIKVSGNAESSSASLLEMKESIERIMKSSNSITGIVRIIRDISKQINLLSLNAAIEAARAGDMGKGFPVVADEVTKLADETSRSIRNIDSLIQGNKEDILNGIEGVNSSIKKISLMIEDIKKIKNISEELSGQMAVQVSINKDVGTAAGKVGLGANEIFHATHDQKAAINEILHAMSEMNTAAQFNSSGAEELALGARQTENLADEIKKDIGFFKI